MSVRRNLPSSPFILVLAPWPSGVGGIEQSVRDLLRALSQLGGRERVGLVQVWSGGPSTDLDCKILRQGPARESELSRISPINKITFAFSAVRAAWKERGNLVVISAHPFLSPVGSICAWISRAPHVIWCYGTESWDTPPRLVRRSMVRANHLVAISSYTAHRVEDFGIPSSKVSVVHVPLPKGVSKAAELLLDSKNSGTLMAREEPYVGYRSPLLLTVGRLDPSERQKGVDTVIRAMPKILESIPNATFLIVGEGGDRERLASLAIECRVDPHVRFAGSVNDQQLAFLYHAADVFVMPSAQEGFGLVFVEAMAFGTPVIGGNHGGTPDVITEGETGFLVPFGDVQALTERILRLLGDSALRLKMGAAGVRDVKARFSFGRFRDHIASLISELSAERHQGLGL